MTENKMFTNIDEAQIWLDTVKERAWSYAGLHINRIDRTNDDGILGESVTVAFVNLTTKCIEVATLTSDMTLVLSGITRWIGCVVYFLQRDLEWLESNGVKIDPSKCDDLRAIQHIIHAGTYNKSQHRYWNDAKEGIEVKIMKENILGLKKMFFENSIKVNELYAPLLVNKEYQPADLEYLSRVAIGLVSAFTAMKNTLYRRNQLGYYYKIVQPGLALAWEMQKTGIAIDFDAAKDLCNTLFKERDEASKKLRGYPIRLPENMSPSNIASWYKELPNSQKPIAERLLEDYDTWLKLNNNHFAINDILERCDSAGRVHPTLRFDTATGRAVTTYPAVSNISRIYRYIFKTASDDLLLVHTDLSTVEVRVAMSLFGDENGINDCNNGDVYCALVREVYPDIAPLNDRQIKEEHSEKRDITKKLLLGIIYGRGIRSIASELKISMAEAERIAKSIKDRYKKLFEGINEELRRVNWCKFARTSKGYMRHLPEGETDVWEPQVERQMRNCFVQAAAAETFFSAVLKIPPLLERYGGKVVFLLHDMVMVEAPSKHAEEIVRILEDTLTIEYESVFRGVKFSAESHISRTWGTLNIQGRAL